jgi:hypothetical protein
MVSIKDGTMKEQLEAYKKRINALDTELRLIFYEKYMPSSAISYLKFPFENQNIPAKVSYVTGGHLIKFHLIESLDRKFLII